MRKKPSYVGLLLAPLSPSKRIEKIVEQGMCIGCGACQSIAGNESIEMQLVDNRDFVAVPKKELESTIVDQILSVCPGTKVEGLPESLVEQDSAYDEVWGIWRQITMAHARDKEIRHQGSTGGLLTALALFLLESKTVDFILHARASTTHPAFGERVISRTSEDVILAAGSRYGPTPTLIDIVQILEQCERSNETFAFIGTPCDVTALRNLAVLDPRVDRYCRYQLTMVCGGFMHIAGLRNVLDQMCVDMDQIDSIRYRGFGCPGPTRIEMKDNTVREIDYLDFWGEDDSAWELPHRCKICPDGIGDSADIAAADAWDGGAPDRLTQSDDLGSNATIVRTLSGEKLFKSAVDAGYIYQGVKLTPRDMDRFQPHQVRKKRSVWARFVGMRAAKTVVPDVRGLRLKPLARRNSIKINIEQARGAKKRVEGMVKK